MIMPRDKHTNIGDSEHPGGMKTFCSPSGRYDKSQGPLPADFWTNVKFKSGNGRNGGRYAQRAYSPLVNRMCEVLTKDIVTGCIDPTKLKRLNPDDAGGQYDSSGGVNGQGNPQGSVCLG